MTPVATITGPGPALRIRVTTGLAAFDRLAQLTGDQVWHRLAAGAVTITCELTQDGRQLPPDGAELTASRALRPEPAPDGSQPQTQYGPDAQRTVAWFAASCDPQARALAARWWPARSLALTPPPGRPG